MVSRENVFEAYRMLLGREPENEEAVSHHLTHPSVAALRREVMASDEFAESCLSLGLDVDRFRGDQADAFASHQVVETGTGGELRDRMWASTAESWRKLGQDAPHWSVLTQDEFLPDAIGANRDAFMETRHTDMVLIDAALARLPNAAALKAGPCLEVGCGVGRATRGLAERFDHVLAVDISAPHLEIARQGMAAEGYSGVEFRHMRRIEDYAALGAPLFFYSRIVLQHNPPPVQAAILRAILHGLAPSGAALFQVVTHIAGYEFRAERYLAEDREGMEMHVLPQPRLFSILRETGMELVEFNNDEAAIRDPRYRSRLVLARKPRMPSGNPS